jgi:hypothetical protein
MFQLFLSADHHRIYYMFCSFGLVGWIRTFHSGYARVTETSTSVSLISRFLGRMATNLNIREVSNEVDKACC